MALPQVLPGAWPAFNRYLYITQVSDSGPLGPLVSLAVYVRQFVLHLTLTILVQYYKYSSKYFRPNICLKSSINVTSC